MPRTHPPYPPEFKRQMLELVRAGRLRGQLPALLAKWEPKIVARIAEVRIRKMKTRWGTCNRDARRIWLNLELVRSRSVQAILRRADLYS